MNFLKVDLCSLMSNACLNVCLIVCFSVISSAFPIACSTALGQTTQAPAKKEQASAADRIERATQNMASKQTYLLAYKLKADETVRWTVEHVASTKTQMAGETEETSSRSVSVKAWKVSNVDAAGKMTFVHSIEAVDMWQQIGDSDPVSYNSRTDKNAPAEYRGIADKLGKPLAVIAITSNGNIIDRQSNIEGAKFGVGDVTIPLPEKAIAVGQKWNIPTSLAATDEDGRANQLNARISYELMKVKDGNAYISFRTEVLTPIESQKIKSQIMQQMTKGFVVFDIAAGRPIRKEVEWDEKVQGYEGPDSFLQYLGRMTEKLVTDDAAAAIGVASSTSKPTVTAVPASQTSPLQPITPAVAEQPSKTDSTQR